MTKPNIILIMADQFRFDAIHAHGNERISTPTLDMLINQGIDFTQAYSATPTCIPARASLMTGLSQKNTGLVGYEEGSAWEYPNYLGGVMANLGYYSKAIGKMHVYPPRKTCGFHHVELHDGYLHATRNSLLRVNESYRATDDYLDWFQQQFKHHVDLNDLGLDCNSWVARPFPYEERLHPTNWATTRAIEFLEKRDPTMPFFLKLSYVRPHSPLDPPPYYFDLYRDTLKTIDLPTLSEWCQSLGLSEPANKIDSLTGTLSRIDYINLLAGYYGLVTHLDHQINRFLLHLQESGELNQSIILFTSDHGDQLGNHGLFRKGFSYQESIHIPLIVYDPGQNIGNKAQLKRTVDQIIELRDILPTLIEFANGESIPSVDGRSFKQLMFKERFLDWREYLHGEHLLGDYSSQYILLLPYKYIWYTQTGAEQLFNLEDDPNENHNLIHSKCEIAAKLRQKLIQSLRNRPERFVQNNQLIVGQKQYPNLAQWQKDVKQ